MSLMCFDHAFLVELEKFWFSLNITFELNWMAAENVIHCTKRPCSPNYHLWRKLVKSGSALTYLGGSVQTHQWNRIELKSGFLFTCLEKHVLIYIYSSIYWDILNKITQSILLPNIAGFCDQKSLNQREVKDQTIWVLYFFFCIPETWFPQCQCVVSPWKPSISGLLGTVWTRLGGPGCMAGLIWAHEGQSWVP